MRLANAILSVAREDSRDSEELKNLGLQSMAMHYRVAPTSPEQEAVVTVRVDSPEYWRSHVEATLCIADQMTDPECKRLLMRVAETYAQLARHAEAGKTTSGRKTGDRTET